MQAAVTYFCQSGFTVSFQKTLLVFSYPQSSQAALSREYHLGEKDFKGFNNIIVFVPRAALEHNDPAIYGWKKSFPITYVVSSDAQGSVPEGANKRIVRAGDSLSLANVHVSVCGSTDAGVSFMVRGGGLRVFHAGDLNLWHWREESSLQEIAQAEEDYYRVVSQIPKGKLDICMFPLDPNLGGFYDAGANHFIMAMKPAVFFPMHFGQRAEIAEDYARRMHTAHTQIFALTKPRETALIDFAVKPPLVRPAEVQRKFFGRGAEPQDRSINLNAYISDDPFAETDLPVTLPGGSKPGEN
ncbi:MAG: MBL fold metallo-hydrolase [Christensenellales bacterium]